MVEGLAVMLVPNSLWVKALRRAVGSARVSSAVYQVTVSEPEPEVCWVRVALEVGEV